MRRLGKLWIVLLGAVALFSPLLANDAPLLAVVDGQLRAPAVGSYFGDVAHGPDSASTTTWREWWAGIDANSGDWAIMPPCPYGRLMERDESRGLASPSFEHPLGTDELGRDLMSRMIHGTGTAVKIGLGAAILAVLLGVLLGSLAGYFGGLVDALISIVLEVSLCFPALFLVLTVGALMGSSATAVILVLGLVYWTSIARTVRGEFLSLREREFVLAARGLGISTPRILFRHMLPCVKGTIIVNAAFLFASAVIVEATLKFLGLAVSGDGESWGTLLAEGKNSALLGAWHVWAFPAFAIAGTVWALHTVTDRRPSGQHS